MTKLTGMIQLFVLDYEIRAGSYVGKGRTVQGHTHVRITVYNL